MSIELKNFLRYERNRATKNIREDDRWGTNNPPGENHVPYANHLAYESGFPEEYIGEPTFQGLIERRKNDGLTTHILDLFGSGEFVTDMSCVDSLTGIKLTKQPAVDERIFERNKYFLLDGNLYSGTTWHKLSNHMVENGIPCFDLVVCHPVAGFEDLTSAEVRFKPEVYIDAYYGLLRRVFGIMSPKDGSFFTEVPNIGNPDEVIQLWAQKMEALGIFVNYSNEMASMKITKTTTSPMSLPPHNYEELYNEAKPHDGFKTPPFRIRRIIFP